MSDSTHWSLHIGHWRRLQIRVHALFLLAAVCTVCLATNQVGQESPGYAAMAVAILFGSVLAHELGHCFAALRCGGGTDRIILGPWGGCTTIEVPRESQAELITTLAGPVVNLAVLLICLPLLLASGVSIPTLLSPLRPGELLDGPNGWTVALKITFWMNWVLVVVNLLPAFPFDGARVLRTLLWPALDQRTAALVAVRTTKLTALGLLILAWMMGSERSAEFLPAWVPLVTLAIFVYFCAQHAASKFEETEWDEELFSYDFSQGYTSLERRGDPPRRQGSSVRRWIEHRRELRRRRQQSQEQDEERQVDAILIRLHETGMDGLSSKERALLNRVSARYRNRLQS